MAKQEYKDSVKLTWQTKENINFIRLNKKIKT